MGINKVICISALMHSDFELYLITEKYGIPYEFLHEYKYDNTVSKFWIDVETLCILAIEAIDENGKSVVETIGQITDEEKADLIKIDPITSGSVTDGYTGDLAEKQAEFMRYSIEVEEYKKEMLGRDYDPSDIVCLTVNLCNEDILAVCLDNELDFTLVADFVSSNKHISLHKIWMEKGTTELVAYSYIYETIEFFEVAPGCLVPESAINFMSRVPVKIPEIKTGIDNVAKYAAYRAMGYSLHIEKFDILIESGFLTESVKYNSDMGSESFTVEELQMLLHKAVEEEDYESAAFLRDEINKTK